MCMCALKMPKKLAVKFPGSINLNERVFIYTRITLFYYVKVKKIDSVCVSFNSTLNVPINANIKSTNLGLLENYE